MCGIAGIVRYRSSIDQSLLVRARDTMAHRGPDSSGIWESDDHRVGLAHRRLSIIDLTPGGHQPMLDPNSGSAITFNGEIYNYVELRERLRQRGHAFRSQSDTEVILAAYREWGLECVNELNGMFAFALYDPNKATVLLARDRAGEKPLFYRKTDKEFAFASEVKALLEDPSVPRRARAQSVNEYFAFGYVTGENTMFDEIYRVPPGGRVVVNMTDGTTAHDRYWTLPTPTSATIAASERPLNEIVDELHTLLKDSVRRQLVADVSVGVMLSGGVDSSLVTAIAAEVSSSKVKTFTARFEGHQGFDEGPYARMVAEHLGTEHIELPTPPASAELLVELARQFDDPIADSSMIPTCLISREIRKHATVAIGGDGGDELFGGYKRYPALIAQERLRASVPSPLLKLLPSVFRMLPRRMPGRGTAAALAGDAGAGVQYAGLMFRADERVALSPVLRAMNATDLHRPELLRTTMATDRSTMLQRATAIDFGSYMVDDVLVKVDRASMLASLEVRAPFLDPQVIAFAFTGVPDRFRATRQDRKVVLRALGERLLPPALDLTRKQGFTIPMDAWMRGAWAPLLNDRATSQGMLVSSSALSSLTARLQNGEALGERLFSMLFLRLWEKEYRIQDVVQ